MMEVFFPQLGHFRQVVAFNLFHTGSAVNEPGDGGGVAQIGGQFGVGVLQEVALAGEAADFGCERGEVDQVFIPDLPVGTGENLEDPHAVTAPQFEVKAQFGFLRGGAEQQRLHARRPGAQLL
ncbi:hypothetical protein [Microbulbifer elongatus]|uniref:hypothetical protein n=1 Tax=Microbulbifer elongatus TaxID=86173 RepID=UPI001E5B59D8|nr:hypothetical protein [Microbulbifer elongatus]